MPHSIQAAKQTVAAAVPTWPTKIADIYSGKVEPQKEDTCICRFATTSAFPLKLEFTDYLLNKHLVEITKASDVIQVLFPCLLETEFKGNEVDKVKASGGAEFIVAAFKYEAANALHSHGIKAEMKFYQLPKLDASKKPAAPAVNWGKLVLGLAPVAEKLETSPELEQLAKEIEDLKLRVKEGSGNEEKAKLIHQKETLEVDIKKAKDSKAILEKDIPVREKQLNDLKADQAAVRKRLEVAGIKA